MKLNKNVDFILKRLNEKGHRADVVGGPVRDFLRGVVPSDYDITTSASPEETKAAFADLRTVDTGIKHGTVSLILDGEAYEITTYRIDGEYLDSRHPESVSFTKEIKEDLARRDFTMNAIAYNQVDGITDLFGGRADIENKIIRAVGDAEKRFSEDALRILRALRFSATLGFEIEEKTATALRKKSYLLTEISAERIFTEWKKLVMGDFSYKVISEYKEVIMVFLPELADLKLPKTICSSDDFLTRQTELFYLCCKEPCEEYSKAMRRLKTDSRTRVLGEAILKNVGKYRLKSLVDAGLVLCELSEETAIATAKLDKKLGNISEDEYNLLVKYLEKGLPFKLSHLEINGEDLRAMGIVGKNIGEKLSELLRLVIVGELENTKSTLVSYVDRKKL